MRSKTYWTNVLLVAFSLSFAGCQSWPMRYTHGVDVATSSAKTRDAHVDRVEGYPGLRFDDALRDELRSALTVDDLAVVKRRGDDVLVCAHDLALRSVETELHRLDAGSLGELSAVYFPDESRPATDLWAEYVARSDAELEQLREQLRLAQDIEAARNILRPIADGLETPVKDQGRFARMAPWLIFTSLSQAAIDDIYADEYRQNADVVFGSATVYDPAGLIGAGDWPDPQDAELLARFAPIIIQEEPTPDAGYPSEDDLIGHPTTPDRDTVVVATDHAEVYGYVRHVTIQGRPHAQLIYTHWYPEHPALKDNDPEAGRVEGVTLRITLGSDGRPAVFETLYNCGCYHRLYPSESLEARARGQFGPPMQQKLLSIERAVKDKKDLIVPNAIQVSQNESTARPVIRVRAGWHGIVDVGYQVSKYPQEQHQHDLYTLMPYEALERTTTPDGRVSSIFYDNGLVKHAERPEGVFFTPAGILSAGQPRQRGTQLIHWDNWNFDDPHLFEKALRLPDGF